MYMCMYVYMYVYMCICIYRSGWFRLDLLGMDVLFGVLVK